MDDSVRKIERVGIDSGGTFTDLAWVDGGVFKTAKVPSNRYSPEEGVFSGLLTIGGFPKIICHGTTVGTNAILARHGGPSAMIVTSGFRDVLFIGRGERKNLYSRSPKRHKPLLRREEIFEINLRPDADGNLLQSHDKTEIENIADIIKYSGAKAVSIGILHSAAHPEHEQNLAEELRNLTGLPVFASSSLAAYPREYERWSLAAMSGYLSPVLGRYLEALDKKCESELVYMASSGGLTPPGKVLENPSICVLSGPAGGALAVKSLGIDRALALDMGGTSTDVTLIAGKLPRTREAEIDGLPLPLPTIDIHTIGAGGGSVVRFDSGGMLSIGPESAGSSPGPACYGNGGPATLTDIMLLAGRIVPEWFLGGEMKLDRAASEKAIRELSSSGMSAEKILDGVIELATVSLTGALRKISVARGIDPSLMDSMFTLVPFGGAGAFFAVECARMMGLKKVIHPRAAGVFSAIGLLQAPLAGECERTILKSVEKSVESIPSARDEMRSEIGKSLDKWRGESEVKYTTSLECRYRGQTHTLEIIVGNEITEKLITDIFEKAYRDRYTYLHAGREIEIVSVRIRGEIIAPYVEFEDIPSSGRNLLESKIGETKIRLDGSWVQAPVYSRDLIPVDITIEGPALIVENFATLYLAPDSVMHLDRKGNAVVEIASPPDPLSINGEGEITDPAQLAIFRALVEAFLDEMGEALREGAFSQNIKERRDYSCAMFDSDGRLVSGAAHIPVHLGSMDTACRAAMSAIQFKPGDVAILNDPYSGGTHLPDITLIFPAFFGLSASPDFYLGVRAHHSDVGGIAPGSLPLSSRLEEEGIVIPPILVVRGGKVIDEVVERLADASRQPDERRGDLLAQISSGMVGLKRLDELARNRGLGRIKRESSGLIDHSERVLLSFLEKQTDGTGSATTFMDAIPDEPGAEIICSVTLTHNPTHIVFDFTNSSDQHPGCLNAVPSIVNSAVLYTLRLFLPPDTPITSGLLNPVTIKLREGSVLNPGNGAAVAGGNVETSQAITETLLIALGQLGWDILASSQGTMNNILFGNSQDSEFSYSFYETIGGGAGACPDSPGASGIQTHMTNTMNTPVEAIERATPLRIRSYGFRPGSGGSGKMSGGDGIVREFEILTPTRLTILSHHRAKGPDGIAGGNPGAPGRNILIRDGLETELPSRAMIDLQEGDILRIETPGGGGYGVKR
jgi:5-oxoprolinase (ATP-hydrolysing)